MKKTRLGTAALAVGVAIALSACGGGDGGTQGGGGAADTIVIDMWAGSEGDTAALEAQLDVVK